MLKESAQRAKGVKKQWIEQLNVLLKAIKWSIKN